MKKNVYFFNRVKGFYRGQYALKYFKDKFLQYDLVYFDNDFFVGKDKGKINNFINHKLASLFRWRAINNADLIWIPAMGYSDTREWEFSKKSKAKIVCDYYVSQYENLTNEFKTVEKNSPEGKRLRKVEYDILCRSEVSLFLTQAEKNYFLEYLEMDEKQVNSKILPLVIDRREKAKLPYLNGARSRPVLAWWGTNLPLHGLKNLVYGLYEAKRLGLDFLFYLIINNETRGADNEEIFALIRKLELEQNIIYQHDFNLHNFSLEKFIIEEVDLCLGSFGGTRKGQSVLMNKIGDALSMNLPSFTEHSAGASEFLKDGESVFMTSCDPTEIGKSLFSVFEDMGRYAKVRNSLNDIYENTCSPNAFYLKVNSIMSEL
jgi:hypothetical protein